MMDIEPDPKLKHERYVRFYPHLWLAKTDKLSLEMRGAHITACAIIMDTEEPLRDCPRWLGHKWGVGTRAAKRIRDELVDGGFLQVDVESGLIFNRTALEVLQHRREAFERKAKAAVARWKAEKARKDEASQKVVSAEFGQSLAETSPKLSPAPTEKPNDFNDRSDTPASHILDSLSSLRSERDGLSHTRRARGRRWGASEAVPAEWRDWAKRELQSAWAVPAIAVDEIDRIAETFGDYWRGVAGQKGVKADWQATWRNWVRRHAQDHRPANPALGRFGPARSQQSDLARRLASARGEI